MNERFIMSGLGFMLFLLMIFLMMSSEDAIINLVVYAHVTTTGLSVIGLVLFVAITRVDF